MSHRKLLETYWERFHAGDIAGALELIAPDAEFQMPGGAVFKGRAAIAPLLGAFHTAFPDLTNEVVT